MLRVIVMVFALCFAAGSQGASTAPTQPASQSVFGPAAPASTPFLFSIYSANVQGPVVAEWNALAKKDNDEPALHLNAAPLLTERDLKAVEAQRNVGAQRNADKTTEVLVQVTLVLTLTPEGSAKLAAFTARAKDQRLAIVYKNQVISAPYVAKKIDQTIVPVLLEGFKLEDAQPIAEEINKAIARARTVATPKK